MGAAGRRGSRFLNYIRVCARVHFIESAAPLPRRPRRCDN